jgi:hypothetical protein
MSNKRRVGGKTYFLPVHELLAEGRALAYG